MTYIDNAMDNAKALNEKTVTQELTGTERDALEAFKRVKKFCDVSTQNVAPFMQDAKCSLDKDLEAISAALQTAQADVDEKDYACFEDMPDDTKASRFVSGLIMAKGNVAVWQGLTEILIKKIRESCAPAQNTHPTPDADKLEVAHTHVIIGGEGIRDRAAYPVTTDDDIRAALYECIYGGPEHADKDECEDYLRDINAFKFCEVGEIGMIYLSPLAAIRNKESAG